MKITFHGAAMTVTGSQHLIEVNGRQILLDCGIYHGKRQEAFERNRKLPFDTARVDVMVLSHAHIDHSGNIPNLVKSGYKGDIFCTFATRDLSAIMLLDSAHIQESDAQYANKKRAKKGEAPVEPIYTQADATAALRNFHAVAYDRPTQILPDVSVTFLDAGHMLGSAIVVLNITDREANREITLVFSGDLGQKGLPILRDPTYVDRADILLCESTYGDRLHDSYMDSEKDLQRIVVETYKRGGNLIIPAFAVGRTQEIVYALHKMHVERNIPNMPIYVDSPLAVNVTTVFTAHPEAYDEETRQFISGNKAITNVFGFEDLHYTRSVQESKELNFLREPTIIISASGMAEAGRIQHHLMHNIEEERNTILIAGYQAENTLGRRILEKQETVKIFGDTYRLRARVEQITGFSAHADRNGLLDWAGAIKKKPVRTFLVHGEEKPMNALAQAMKEQLGFERVEVPALHQTFNV
jgi:metallo-beta-lactamase family protein